MKNFKVFLRTLCLCLLLCMMFVSCNGDETVSGTEGSSENITDEPTDTSQPKDKTVIKAMSFNIWGGGNTLKTSNDGTALPRMNVFIRGPKINNLLNGEDIDVAGLQEVSHPNGWDEWMNESLDEKYSIVAAFTADRGSGAYILYKKDKFEVVENGAFCLVDGAPSLIEGTPQKFSESDAERICNWALFKVKETGEIFVFMDTHLSASTAEGSKLTLSEVRTKQMSVIVSKISVIRDEVKQKYGVSDCPLVLVGDMNSRYPSEEYSTITKVLNDSLKVSKGKTVNSKYATYTGFWHCKNEYTDYRIIEDGGPIDYIFISKENISVLNYKMIHTSTNLCPYGEYISDHNAIIAELELY